MKRQTDHPVDRSQSNDVAACAGAHAQPVKSTTQRSSEVPRHPTPPAPPSTSTSIGVRKRASEYPRLGDDGTLLSGRTSQSTSSQRNSGLGRPQADGDVTHLHKRLKTHAVEPNGVGKKTRRTTSTEPHVQSMQRSLRDRRTFLPRDRMTCAPASQGSAPMRPRVQLHVGIGAHNTSASPTRVIGSAIARSRQSTLGSVTTTCTAASALGVSSASLHTRRQPMVNAQHTGNASSLSGSPTGNTTRLHAGGGTVHVYGTPIGLPAHRGAHSGCARAASHCQTPALNPVILRGGSPRLHVLAMPSSVGVRHRATPRGQCAGPPSYMPLRMTVIPWTQRVAPLTPEQGLMVGAHGIPRQRIPVLRTDGSIVL